MPARWGGRCPGGRGGGCDKQGEEGVGDDDQDEGRGDGAEGPGLERPCTHCGDCSFVLTNEFVLRSAFVCVCSVLFRPFTLLPYRSHYLSSPFFSSSLYLM